MGRKNRFKLCSEKRKEGCPVGKHCSLIGFTLIEMLIVTGILAVISLAIYANFNNGMRIRQKVNKRLPEEGLNIFFAKFAFDLRNSFRFSGIDFSGTKNNLEFAALINSLRLQKKTVGKLIYVYDSQTRILDRKQSDFACVYGGESGTVRQQLGNVRSLRFQYYFYDEQKKEYLWQDEWLKEGLPLAVRIELELDDGTEIKKFIKTAGIPSGG